MLIRNATIADLPALVRIYNQAILAGQRTGDLFPLTLEDRQAWFDSHTSDAYPILVAEVEGLVAGYLSFSPYRPGRMALRHTAEISYYVDESHHRRGVASELLRNAIKMCPALQISTIFAILMDTNGPSIMVLKQFGFSPWGHLPRVADFDGTEVGHLYYGLRIN